MSPQPHSRDSIIDSLIAAVPGGQRELTADDWSTLLSYTNELLEVSAGAGEDELLRFRQLRDRSLPVKIDALTEMHRGKVIVVTGGTGCIGSSLLTELARLGPARLISISRGMTAPWSVVAGVDYLRADIRDLTALLEIFRAVRPALVYHLAAQHHPGLAEVDVAHTLSTNVTGSANVFQACRSTGTQIVHASTGKALRPFSRDIYAASKKMSEWLLAQAITDGQLIGSAARFTHVVDNSIIYRRLCEWTTQRTPIRLHSADSSFYLQSAREAAQLLMCMGLDAVPGEVTVGAIRDLGWPISLLDLAVGWLAECQDPVPLYICGFEAGYDSNLYPALYDPRTSGDRSPLFNALESPGAPAFDRSADVDICSVSPQSDLQTLALIADLGESVIAGASTIDLRRKVAECGWSMLDTMVATIPTEVLQRHSQLVETIPTPAFDCDDRQVVDTISAELRGRSQALTEHALPQTVRPPIPSDADLLLRRTPAMVASTASTSIEFERMTRGLTTSEFPVAHTLPVELAGIRSPVGTGSATGSDPSSCDGTSHAISGPDDPELFGRYPADPQPDSTGALDIDDEEKIAYFGPQHRWYLVVRFIAFAGLIASLLRFTYSDARISALLAAIIPLVVVSMISLYTSTRPRRMSLADHQLKVANWPHRLDSAAPSVDVYLPTAGESLEVLTETYLRVARMRYPGRLEIFVLDDAGRPEVEALAGRYGFAYLSRPNRGHMKKAGNLAYGYGQSTGSIIAVFDADFAPRPDYLLELVPYMDDDSIGIVQSPQYFQTHGLESWLQRAAGSTQELFYRWVQPSRDSIGAPICVGTCALYRRSALAAAGGFAQIEHSEDVHTGIKMMGSGYQVRYVPVILAKGLCPDSLGAFISQQYRWCSGSMSLMVNPEFRRMKLTVKQRLCFWSGFGYFITTVLAAFTILIPPIYLLWWAPQAIAAINYVWLIPAFLVYPLIMVVHRGDWRMNVLRVQLIYSYAHAIAVWDTYRGHTAEWVATGVVEKAPLSTKVIRLMVSWILLTQTALWSGVGYVAWNGLVSPANLWPLVALAGFAAYIQLPIVLLGRRHLGLTEFVPGGARLMARSR